MRQHFDDFVTARGGLLWRTAWLLTGDVDRAEQLLETALARVWAGRHDGGPDSGLDGGLDDMALAALVQAYLPRRGGDEAPSARPGPDTHADVAWTDEDRQRSELRAELVVGLATLTRYQRAGIVLLHAELRDPADVAAVLGRSSQRLDSALAEATVPLRRSRLVCDPAADAAAPAPGHGRLTADEIRWLRVRLADAPPEPPFAPDRVARAKAVVDRRRRRTLFGAAAGLVALGALLVPTVLTAWPQGATGGVRDTAAAAGVPELPLPPLEDPRDVPATCAGLGDAPVPAAPLDLAAYPVLWLRFCPVGDFGEALTDLNFAPGVIATHELTGVVRHWVSVPGRAPCPFARPRNDGPRNDGSVRLQIGTADGVTHVVDAEIGECGDVVVDGGSVAVDGRRVFTDAVGAVSDQLARQFASEPPRPGPGAGDRPRCPRDPTLPGEADRFVTAAGTDYPRVEGMPLPLPVEAGLVCRYESRGGGRAARLESTRTVSTHAAEQIRAAYLAQLPPSGPVCETHLGADVYAVVLSDVTGSWRTFSLDREHCNQVIGPGAERGTAGRWLLEAVVRGSPRAVF